MTIFQDISMYKCRLCGTLFEVDHRRTEENRPKNKKTKA